jgi:pimeloyl-ACP methyl ester carboxylesterase
MKNLIQYSSLPNFMGVLQKKSLSPIAPGILSFLVLLFMGCEKIEYGPEETRQFGSEMAIVQEISFPSNGFTIVGDLRTPTEGDHHPVILMIHGSGGATRNGAVPFVPMIEIFLRNGYAVLSWDKPGSGSSEGEFDQEHKLTENAQIIVDAIDVLAENPSIDLAKVGLWGISQAGWIMPLALDMSDKITFMIVVSGGGEDGIEQGAYQVAQMIACDGGSEEDVSTVEHYWAIMNKAVSYEEYSTAAQIVLDIPGVYEKTGLIMSDKGQWAPWPRDIDAFFDPVEVLQRTTIPVLAFFGELDKNIDPVQGAQAYESALESAGNQDYMVQTIEGAGHVMVEVETGCLGEFVGKEYMSEYLETLEFWIMDR